MSDTEATIKSIVESTHALVGELPERVLYTYARLWQLETWIRRLVYIELRALAGNDWQTRIRGSQRPLDADQRLTHMPTAERDPLSYVQFSELRRIISDDWRLFEPFLPPKSIWEARLEEISQIRHRIAHFRKGHQDDLKRVVQLLRDLDQGFWRFCTSYNDPHPVLPQSDDLVESHFLDLDQFPWGQVSDRKWIRTGFADPAAKLNVTVEVLCRPWVAWSIPVVGKPGFLYDVTIHVRQERHLDYRQLIDRILGLQEHLVHICLDTLGQSVRVTIPAILGAALIVQIVEKIYEASLYCLRPGLSRFDVRDVQKLTDSLPEYILGPENPLTFLTPDMPCSFFGA